MSNEDDVCYANGMTPAQADKYVKDVYKFSNPRSKALKDLRRKHFIAVNKVTSTLNSTRKRSGQNLHTLSFKPVGLYHAPGHFMPPPTSDIEGEAYNYNDGILSVKDQVLSAQSS